VQPLRIITINTGKGDGEYRARVDWMAHELLRLGPDIICCQEAFRDQSGALDTAAFLMKRLGLNGFWAPARRKLRECEGVEMESWSGLALLSRTPWTLVDSMELPSDDADGERIAVFGLIEEPQTRLAVANVHLTHLRGADDLRREQLRCVIEHPIMKMKGTIRLICGDFNTTAEGPVLAGLLGETDYGNVQDAYYLGGGPPGRSSLPPRPGLATGRRIDHLLSIADAAPEHPVFTSSTIVLDRPEPRSGLLPSDHYGVATTMVPLRAGVWRRREGMKLVK
jgi:endonuclease/exonuclease/phosphatase family metal-dependent hydrolase